MNPLRLFGLLGIWMVGMAPAGRVHALTVDAGGGTVNTGMFSYPAIVAGHPAIAYTDERLTEVKFVRAKDPAGKEWGTPTVIASTSLSHGYITDSGVVLSVVNGNPAICYLNPDNINFQYIRASDPEGRTWNEPIVLKAKASTRHYQMEIVDGHPALCFRANNGLQFIRADDANGSTWGTPITVDPNNDVYTSMKIVEGHPAIVYDNNTGLWYRRATDAAGTAWGDRVRVSGSGLITRPSERVFRPSLQIVNGRPAVSYSLADGTLLYVRASDPCGNSWPPQAVVTRIAAGGGHSLAVVNGTPLIGYTSTISSTGNVLKTVESVNSDGMGQWAAPFTVDGVKNTGINPSMLEVDGRPAVVYHNSATRSLEFIRATPERPGPRWPPDPMLEAGSISGSIPDGGTAPRIQAKIGSTVSRTFTLKNPCSGSTDLVVSEMSLDGPDASEFSIPTSITGRPIRPEKELDFRVRYTPLTSGIKQAALHITTNAEGAKRVYDIILTASSLPDIRIERPEGTVVPDGGTVEFPTLAAGDFADLTFTLRNSGDGGLGGLGMTIDGPDRREFSLSSFTAGVILPDETRSFTVRYAPVTGGNKMVTLRVTSNVTGSRNPYDISITTRSAALDPRFQSPSGQSFNSMAVREDGKILTSSADSPIACLNPDGSPDTSFFPPPVSGGTVDCIAVQKDGRILIGGSFNRVGGITRRGLARLLRNGEHDTAFAPEVSEGVACLAVQPNGQILAGGRFTRAGPTGLSFLVRLNTNGALDLAFNPSPDSFVRCLALQPDGRILAGGNFTRMRTAVCNALARLNFDGTRDSSVSGNGQEVNCVAVRRDGRILAGGSSGLLRLSPDGTSEGFLPVTGAILDLALQTDGRYIAAGNFTLPGGTPSRHLVRFKTNETVDEEFQPKLDLRIKQLAMQADGKVFVLGDFSSVDGLPAKNLARLESGPAFTTLKRVGNSKVRWLRSGTSPEVSDVSFEVKPDGFSEWTLLGAGVRGIGGWELRGLTLPESGFLRARARSGVSVMETVAPVISILESWRMQHFGGTANAGDGADNADPDQDGLTNFVEYAFGLSPVNRGSGGLPEFTHGEGGLGVSFTTPEGREDVVYSAEWSATMEAGTWVKIPDTGAGRNHVFSVTGTGERVFVRYVVRMR